MANLYNIAKPLPNYIIEMSALLKFVINGSAHRKINNNK